MGVERSDPIIAELLDRVRALEEERSILQTLHAYSHFHDGGRDAEWVDLFTADGAFDARRPTRSRRNAGRAALQKYRSDIGVGKKDEFHMRHFLGNPRITVRGDEADVEAYFVVFNDRATGHTPQVFSFGRYTDRLKKEDGCWRFKERIVHGEAYAPE